MQKPELEPRPLYGIGTIARLTGLKPDTLRVWERRYGLGASRKSKTGRRQYTQSDLEHLQLVSALVAAGSRIGEIASSERKTLEVLLRSNAQAPSTKLPEPKPHVVFVGEGLCDWLDEHQGCLNNVNAQLARFGLQEDSMQMLEGLQAVDCLVVEFATLASRQMASLKAVRDALQPRKILLTYQFCNERWLKEFEKMDIRAVQFPPDPAQLAFELSSCIAEQATLDGAHNLGDLMEVKPRQYSAVELSAARKLESTLDCECPRHIADLIRALAQFEEYSASCSVENWRDAAVHSCIYAYTGQARWLMEKAMGAVLEDRQEELAIEMAKQG